ncbi:hypothetical protein Kpol_1058p34 [Vanderwaltozyma polyspora DSM 70294]|uniref:Ubiquitin-like protease family profile domain-containing protein n=1 Tax=Vanderwaltozyma polyspora (strain ATCC 22028 / DSM 70294 / BCRC 21397 / CBS 2163 / NBRC 10782 / NRRL Y-8283 / UCD 57-17) TaxID=436907 RepID=A7TJR8_VANPO|nr:uncharacterized protein Kpol_1058p34 [Vanderwaltozyma polyspora DSM 70294]EDO17497.1 hypothetical protein Kpol_1058p34 [Vanderwaltozyma polyspora DSM 70294]
MMSSNVYKRFKSSEVGSDITVVSSRDEVKLKGIKISNEGYKRSISLGYEPVGLESRYSSRRIHSTGTYTDRRTMNEIKSDENDFKGIIEGIKMMLISTRRAIWDTIGMNGDAYTENLNDVDVESWNTTRNLTSSSAMDMNENTDLRNIKNVIDDGPVVPYGSSFIRRNKRYRRSRQSSLVRSILQSQYNETISIGNTSQDEYEIPPVLIEERKKQLELLDNDNLKDEGLRNAIWELTEKIKNFWSNDNSITETSTIEETKNNIDDDQDVVILGERKCDVTRRENIPPFEDLKFKRYIANADNNPALIDRYEGYKDNNHDLRRKLKAISEITLVPELSKLELKKVLEVFRQVENRILAKTKNIEITLRDFKTLDQGRWLNDTIIEFFMKFVEQNTPGSIAYNSFFYSNLSRRGYDGVRRWMKKKKVNILDLNKVFVPINLNQSHWVLCIIDIPQKSILFADSLSVGPSSTSFHVMENLQDYIIKESNGKIGSNFKLVYLTTPQQDNGFDCGIYLCLNALYSSKNKPLIFSKNEAMNLRLYIGHLILSSS